MICMLIGHSKKVCPFSLAYFATGRDFENRGRTVQDDEMFVLVGISALMK